MNKYYVKVDWNGTCAGNYQEIYEIISNIDKKIDLEGYVDNLIKEDVEKYCCSQCYPSIDLMTEEEIKAIDNIEYEVDETITIYKDTENIEEFIEN